MEARVCLGLLLVLASCYATSNEGPIVDTSYGQVQGLTELHTDGRQYDVFKGIPFASPPVGDNRWKKPQPLQGWQGVRSATEFGAYCTQLITPLYIFTGMNEDDSEDCLYLNVYVPTGVKYVKNLPVMVWIYGGAFRMGASDMYPGQELALNGNVLVVSVNYRVDTLGFASTGDKWAEGNYGLWDQVAALQWVQGNIEAFGGDSNRVTIFGQSAGGASVSHLSLSPVAQPLFHRVLAISGSSSSFFALSDWLPQHTRNLATANLCLNLLSNKRTMECLRKKKPKQLEVTGLAAPLLLSGRVPGWVPRVDGELVTRDPRRAMEEGLARSHDLLLGHTHDDGAFLVFLNPLGMGYRNLLNLCKWPGLVDKLLRLVFKAYDNPDELVDMIYAQYPDLQADDLDTRTKAAVRAVTDFLFGAPATLEAGHHARSTTTSGKSTFMYEFSYRQSFLKYVSWVNGSHIDDLYSVFGEPFMEAFRRVILRRRYEEEDKQVRDVMQKYYANFAHTGNPNEGPHSVDLEWPKYDSVLRKYMEFGEEPEVRSQDLELRERYDFWNLKFYHAIKRSPSSRPYLMDSSIEKLPAVRELSALVEGILGNISSQNTTHISEDLTSVVEIFLRHLGGVHTSGSDRMRTIL